MVEVTHFYGTELFGVDASPKIRNKTTDMEPDTNAYMDPEPTVELLTGVKQRQNFISNAI